MEYDDGPAVHPGEDLSIGNQDVGQATYDSDGDGQADSVIMAMPGDQVDVLADTNHDGQVDTVYEVNDDGSVTVLQPDDSGSLVEVGTGHVDDQGHIDVGGTTDGGDTPAPSPDGTTDHGDTGDTGAGDIGLTEDGHTVDVGAPTVDLTGDGTNETVVLQGSDGSTVLVADADGDGTADHIIEIHSDNTVTFAVPDGHGGWVVEGSGHVDAQGNISEDSKDGAGDPYNPPDVADQGGTDGTDTTDHGTTDHGTTDNGTTDGSGEDISITIQGQTYDVGHATIDSDGNGSPDTAVVQGQDGSTLLVTDANGDGTGDQVIEISADGSATVAVAGPGRRMGDGRDRPRRLRRQPGHRPADRRRRHRRHDGDQRTPVITPAGPRTPETTPEPRPPGPARTSPSMSTARPPTSGPRRSTPTATAPPTPLWCRARTAAPCWSPTPTETEPAIRSSRWSRTARRRSPSSDGNGGWETVATGHVDSDGNLVLDQQQTQQDPSDNHPSADALTNPWRENGRGPPKGSRPFSFLLGLTPVRGDD